MSSPQMDLDPASATADAPSNASASAPLRSVDPFAAQDSSEESEPVIAFDRASIQLGGRVIWQDVSLAVRAGDFLAVLGPNGAGKSTLLKAMLGLLPLSAGAIRILGAPVQRGNRAIGYLPQRRTFDADVRVRGRDIVRLGLDGTRWGLPIPLLSRLLGAERSREEDYRVDEVIDLVGAAAYAHRPIGELSGGEQQRLLIAQALVTNPRILLLDEPFDSLDLRNQQAVSALIRRISQEQGITVLLVAHDVNPILPYLDRVIYLAGGQTLIGAPEEVITSATLSRLYGSPIEVLHASDGRIVVVGQPEEVSYHADRAR